MKIRSICAMVGLAVLIIMLLIFFIYNRAGEKKAGTIVLLNGTSSAGKTAIMQELQKIYDSSFVFINGDEFLAKYLIEHPIPEEIAEREEYVRQFFGSMFLHAKQLSQDGQNVFVDTVEFDDHYDYYCSILGCSTTVKVLVYCPLNVIIERVERRNKSGNAREKRNFNQAFSQFEGIYIPQRSSDEIVVDTIQISHMKKALYKAQEETRQLMKDAGKKDEEIDKQITEFTTSFSKHFKLNELEEITLVPIHAWNLIVNTGIHSPEQAARIIADFLNNKH